MELRKIYQQFSYTMSHDEFAEFTNPANDVGKLLQAHFVAMQLIMTPISKVEYVGRPSRAQSPEPSRVNNDGTTVRWLKALHRNIPPHMLKYYEWPLFIENEVAHGRIVS